MRALIVEDEPLGYRRLRKLLEADGRVSVVGWSRDAPSAIEAVATLQPDVVFLDVELAGSSGLEVARAASDREPLFVFATAHSEYAVDAFEVAAVDYLLKPYSASRVEETITRLGASVRRPMARRPNRKPTEARSRPDGEIPRAQYAQRISVPWRGSLRVVPVSDIDWIEADRVYCRIHVDDEVLLLRESLSGLEERLDPARFCRVHRSSIVALDRAASYSRKGGAYSVQLSNGQRVRVGRSYRKDLERRLGC